MSIREVIQSEVSGAGGAPTKHAVYVRCYDRQARHSFCEVTVTLAAKPGFLRHRRNPTTRVGQASLSAERRQKYSEYIICILVTTFPVGTPGNLTPTGISREVVNLCRYYQSRGRKIVRPLLHGVESAARHLHCCMYVDMMRRHIPVGGSHHRSINIRKKTRP